jgi:hypothetical protein
LVTESKPTPSNLGWPPALAPPFDQLLRTWLLTVAGLSVALVYGLRIHFGNTQSRFFLLQDLPLVGLCLVLTAGLGFVRSPAKRWTRAASAAPAAWALGLTALVAILGVAGAPLIFNGYTLSLDEFMANFDARIFAHGQLMARIDPEWRPLVGALQPMFVLEPPGFWASGYLPVNAAVRALASLAGLEGLVNPFWSSLSVLLAHAVARQLWPARPMMALGAATLLATSAQLLIMSMTAYAMPAHLALNLLWLWCFLRGGRLGHAAAIVVAFFACGLHQLVFHPLFAAPFVLQLWLDRRWRLAGLYSGAYAAIALFWIEYWPLDMRLTGVPAVAAGAFGDGHFLSLALSLLAHIKLENTGEMAQSLVRFVSWQNPLTTPLALAGSLAAIRAKGHLRALTLGVLLTIFAMLVLEPTPVHGWGYRYLHGLLGSVCLVAVWTWTRLTDGLLRERRAIAEGAFVLACAVSLVLLAPLRAWQAWSYVRPYAEANAAVQNAPAQVVIIDRDYAHWFDIGTLTRNDPFLHTGPKVMVLGAMDGPMLRQVCARYSVAIFDGRKAQALRMDLLTADTYLEGRGQRELMARLKCGRRIE